MIIHRFSNGDTVEIRGDAIIVCFSGKRSVLGTAPLNGGRRDELRWIFNHGGETSGEMKAPTYEGHVAKIAEELGLEPEFSSGLSTAAYVKNTSMKTQTFEDITVTALVTGGVDINAGRVGEQALWHEREDGFVFVAGTINIMLFIDAQLSEGALARVLVTCPEAKTAALQELLVPSCYSGGLATGSGTDGTIIVSNPQSSVKLTEAGKHFKLGELIGKTVMAAAKEALFLETGLCPERQMDILARMGRFGVTEAALIERLEETGESFEDFAERLESIRRDRALVTKTSCLAHILDQLSWGMIRGEDALGAASVLLALMGMSLCRIHKHDDLRELIVDSYIDGILKLLL